MTTTTPPRSAQRSPSGSPPSLPLGSTRRRQMPWIAAGVVLVVLTTLGFVFVGQSLSQRSPVIVAAGPIEAGQEISRADLRYVDVATDPGLSTLGPSEEALVIGSAARGPVPEGTPLTADMVVEASALVPEGEAIVGAVLEPGRYPVSGLRAGDVVRLVNTAPDADVLGSADLGSAIVWSIEPTPDGVGADRFVSLRIDEAAAAPIGRAGAAGELLLVLTGNG